MQDVVSSSSASSSLPTFSIPLSCPPRIIHESSSSSMISLLSTSSHVSSMSSSYPYHYQPTPTQPMSHHHTWQSPSPQSSHHHTSSPSPSPIKPTRHPWLMDLPSRTSPKPTSSSHTHTHTHTHSTHVSHSQSPSLSSSTSHRTLDIPSSATSHSDMLSSSHSIPVPSHLMSMSPPLPPPRAHIPLPSDYFDTCARRGPLYIATHDTQPHQHIHVDHHPHLWNFLHTQILLKVPQKSEEEKALEATIDEYATWTVPLPPRKKINKTTHSASTSTSTSTSSDPSNASSTPKSTTSKRKSTSTPHYSFVCDCGNISMCKCICTIQPTASAITYQSSDSIKRFKVEETGMMDANELMALAMKIAMNGDE